MNTAFMKQQYKERFGSMDPETVFGEDTEEFMDVYGDWLVAFADMETATKTDEKMRERFRKLHILTWKVVQVVQMNAYLVGAQDRERMLKTE